MRSLLEGQNDFNDDEAKNEVSAMLAPGICHLSFASEVWYPASPPHVAS
jgi:hypothetical protein